MGGPVWSFVCDGCGRREDVAPVESSFQPQPPARWFSIGQSDDKGVFDRDGISIACSAACVMKIGRGLDNAVHDHSLERKAVG